MIRSMRRVFATGTLGALGLISQASCSRAVVFGRVPLAGVGLFAKRNVHSSPPAAGNIRVEKDTMGELEVPADRLWGAQT